MDAAISGALSMQTEADLAGFDAFPYPARDPDEERQRLITGSPSHPLEIDHFVFAGKRRWAAGTRVLVAGGGTGDAVVQIAQVLTSANKPYHITYLDLSRSARQIAEARLKARDLPDVTFVTGDLSRAAEYGPFDYIDCANVLQYCPDPAEALAHLARALSPEGGLGLSLPAPYGMAALASLRASLQRLVQGTPRERLRRAKAIVARLPESHPVHTIPALKDALSTDAGFYQLLMHGPLQGFTIDALMALLEQAGLHYIGTPQPYLYDPARFMADASLLKEIALLDRMHLAEALNGGLRSHVVYAAPNAERRVARTDREAVPHLKGVSGEKLAQAASKSGVIPVSHSGMLAEIPVSAMASRCVALVDGRRSLEAISEQCGLDAVAFSSIWRPLSETLTDFGLLHYSRLLHL